MLKTFERILIEQKLLAPGDRVLVALSGGADSVALLHLLLGIADDWPLEVEAAHLDHALRPESVEEAALVRRLCDSLSVPLALGRADICNIVGEGGGGLEEAAREVRRDFLLRTARERDCSAIALGHHRGDQAETVLHRLIRGSGLSGLAAMRFRNGPFIRPLLDFSRAELRDWLTERGIEWIEDPSNRDPAFTRNRIRRELIPLMQSFNPRLEEHLARLAKRIATEEDWWDEEADRALAALSRTAGDGLRLDRDGLLDLHPALRLRVLRRALEALRGDLRGLEAVHLEAVEELLQGGRPQAGLDLPGAWAGRRYETLWLRREPPRLAEPFEIIVEGLGTYPLPSGGEVCVEVVSSPQGEDASSVEFDAASVPFPLRLRTPRPGDRFRPTGGGGGKKLKDYFIDAKVEREGRRAQPLAVGHEILWVVGRRRCEGLRPAEEGEVLRLVFRPGEGTNCL